MLWQTLFSEMTRRIWEQEILDNSVLRWVIAVAAFILLAAALRALKSFVEHRSQIVVNRTGLVGWELIRSLGGATSSWFLLVTALYLASQILHLPARTQGLLRVGEITMLLLQAALWGNVVLQFCTNRWVRRRLAHDPANVPFTTFLGLAGRVALWTLILLLIMENLGIQVTALLTGLGIGGVAVALALQSILGDLFASLSIVVDKPFVIGDFITVDQLMGTVEHIGLKTTRVRSLSGEQLVFPNNNLLQSRIRNYQRMNERRVQFKIGVTYETPVDKLAALPLAIRAAIESQSPVRFDRAHFQGLSDSSLDFEIVYFVLSSNYNRYMDVQQAINLELVRHCAKEGISFAHPTQIQYLPQSGSRRSSP